MHFIPPDMSKAAIDFLTFRVDVFNEIAKRAASQAYEERHGVSLRELRVLRLAYAFPDITQGEIVAQSHLEKTQVSKMVTHLARRELLVRQIGAKDARWVHLRLTDAGREVVKDCNRIGRKLEKYLLSGITPAELDIFESSLVKLTAHVQAYVAPPSRPKPRAQRARTARIP